MKQDLPFRIVVLSPPKGVAMKVQRGRDELLTGVANKGDLTFQFEISVDNTGTAPNFLGKYAQGPKDARFVYVNSGTYAGEHLSKWGRRAKISLMTITKGQVNELIADPTAILEASFNGTGKDGGPTCASVKGIEWKVVKK